MTSVEWSQFGPLYQTLERLLGPLMSEGALLAYTLLLLIGLAYFIYKKRLLHDHTLLFRILFSAFFSRIYCKIA